MSSETIAVIAGIVLSIVFEFDTKTPAQKFLGMAGIGAGVVAIAFGLGCANVFSLNEVYSCNQAGAEKAVATWVSYFVSNQTVFGTLNMVKKQREL